MNNAVFLRYVLYVGVMLTFGAVLAGCQADASRQDEAGLLPHLVVDLQLPDDLQMAHAGSFVASVHLADEPVDVAEVSFLFWTEAAPEAKTAIKATAQGDGRYSADYTIPGEGLYVVRTLVQMADLEAKPAKRFAIGEAAVLELAALEAAQSEGAAQAAQAGGGGHHH